MTASDAAYGYDHVLQRVVEKPVGESWTPKDNVQYLRGVLLGLIQMNGLDLRRALCCYHPDLAFCKRVQKCCAEINVDCDVFEESEEAEDSKVENESVQSDTKDTEDSTKDGNGEQHSQPKPKPQAQADMGDEGVIPPSGTDTTEASVFELSDDRDGHLIIIGESQFYNLFMAGLCVLELQGAMHRMRSTYRIPVLVPT